MGSVRDLLLKHAGARIAVIGGGPSRIEQAARLPEGTVCLSANQHGCLTRPCEYIVACDNIETMLRPYGVPIISPHRWADYRMSEHPQLLYTGMHSAWVAWMLGAREILLVGMDCYADPRGNYAEGVVDPVPDRVRGVDQQIKYWKKVLACIPVPIRAMAGPLVPVFGAFDPAEEFPPYVPTERHVLLAQCAGTKVEILKDHGRERGNHCFKRGQVLELPRNEAQHLLALRVARLHIEATE
jgi:hypothetical protein